MKKAYASVRGGLLEGIVTFFAIAAFPLCLRSDLSSLLDVDVPRILDGTAASSANVSEKQSERIPHNAPSEASVTQNEGSLKYILFEEEFLGALVQHLKDQVGEIDGDLRVYPLRRWNPVRLPSADWQMTITGMPLGRLETRTLINLTISCGSEGVIELQIPVRCELWRAVYMARRQLNRGECLEADDLESSRVDVLKSRYTLIPDTTDLSQYELSQTLGSGQPLRWRDVIRQPLVRRGQVVDVLAREGYLKVTMKAQALQSGAKGDFIPVRNFVTRRDIQAQVTHEGAVSVYF